MEISTVIERMLSKGEIDKALDLLVSSLDNDESILGLIIEKWISSNDHQSLLKCFEKTGEAPDKDEIDFLMSFVESSIKKGDYYYCQRLESLIQKDFLTLDNLREMLEINFVDEKNLKLVYDLLQRMSCFLKKNPLSEEDIENEDLVKEREELKLTLENMSEFVICSFFRNKFVLKFFKFIPDKSKIKKELEGKFQLAIKDGDLESASSVSYVLERKLSRAEVELILEAALKKCQFFKVERILKILDRKITEEELMTRFLYLIEDNQKDEASKMFYLFSEKNRIEMLKVFSNKFLKK
ncbi:MAG: hypothetical protein WCY43_02440 [Patescibacteria group bacterium]|nr:hypothetical protein [Patescibacteria group bacterium]